MSFLLRLVFTFLLAVSLPTMVVHAQDEMDDSMPSAEEQDVDSGEQADAEDEGHDTAVIEDDLFEDPLTAEQSEDDDENKEEEVLSPEEAKSLIDNLPTAKDAVTGTIPTDSSVGAYDIYGRQLSYRESAKELRNSIEIRRENFEAPRLDNIEQYRDVKEKVYAAESKAFQDKLKEEEELKAKSKADSKANSEETKKDDVVKVVSSSEDAADDEHLKEQEIPPKDGEEVTKKKKVVTSPDAPDFDPKNIHEDDVSTEDATAESEEEDTVPAEPELSEEDMSETESVDEYVPPVTEPTEDPVNLTE